MLKPQAETCKIKEQIITDQASGLTLQFERDEQGYTRLRIFGTALPYRNRELIFSAEGVLGATGTLTRGLSKPAWLTRPSDLAA